MTNPSVPSAALMLMFLVGTTLRADDAVNVAFFESKVRPVLIEHCYRCHSTKSGKAEGGLRLDTRTSMRVGGDRGPVVVPGKPAQSLLLIAVAHADPDLRMPPNKSRLPDAVIDDLKAWIRAGAADPRVDEAPTTIGPPVTLEDGRRFWAFRKPTVSALPSVRDASWPRRDLDHFVLARLEAAGLVPSPDADPATLLRRLHFDLVGLPPSPGAVREFLIRVRSDGVDKAVEDEADRLLASSAFGERWGRHWLDVARYAESSGKEANITFPYAFRYRNYVLDAVNADVPFDRFLTEQLAGDLLPADSDAERARLLIATGFLAVGPKNLDEANAKQFAADVVDEQIDAVTRAVMAQSVACARCHDHKFDPFPMTDYYALAGVFASTRTYFGTFISPANRVGGDPLVLPRGAGLPIYHASVKPEEVGKLKADLATLKAAKPKTLTEALGVFWRMGGVEGQLEKVDDTGKALPLAMGVTDKDRPDDAPLLARGEVGRPGPRVPRAFPKVVDVAATIPSDHSGRREFARWLTHPDHPLTSRVMVNRVWRHLFGAGLVQTVDNFGFSGDRPSHPQLLDQLAVRFVTDGWSVKRLVRDVVLSRTYRQSSGFREDGYRADPDNRLLWRVSKRRLDAEAIRDAMLAVSGELNPARAEGSLVAKMIGDRPVSLIGLDSRLPIDLDGSRHRSVYLPVLRDRLPDVLDVFDFAEPSLVTGDRATTNVPVQALYMMNSPFVTARSRGMAGRLMRESADRGQQIRYAFHLCYCREPDTHELAMSERFFTAGAMTAGTDAQLLAAFCQALLAAAEFRNLD